jgi:hypothetical protein
MEFTDIEELRKAQNKSIDRVLVLEIMDGKESLNSIGLVDRSLFDTTNKNRLHAIMDIQTCLWSCKYDRGQLPAKLDMKFTSFKKLLEYITVYFNKRNIRIKEIMD